MSIVKILDTEIEIDFLDFEAMEKIEMGYDKVLKDIQGVNQKFNSNSRQSEVIRWGCDIVYKFFDDSIGEGTSEKIFHGKYNFGDAMHAMGQFAVAKSNSASEIKELSEQYNGLLNTKPAGNRQQRRQNGKSKQNRKPNYHK